MFKESLVAKAATVQGARTPTAAMRTDVKNSAAPGAKCSFNVDTGDNNDPSGGVSNQGSTFGFELKSILCRNSCWPRQLPRRLMEGIRPTRSSMVHIGSKLFVTVSQSPCRVNVVQDAILPEALL